MQSTLSTNTSESFGVEKLRGDVCTVDLVTIVLSLVILTGLISIININSLVILPIGILNLIIISIIS